MDNFYLKIIAIILIVIIIIVVFILLNKTEKINIPDIIKTRVEKLSEPTQIIKNKITIVTERDKINNALELFKYKHNKFLKNLDNSIEFCIDSNKFLLADTITEYKKLYIELYNMKKTQEKNNPKEDITNDEKFLLKLIKLDNLNSIIQTQN
tara:strand:+ start:45 stop:500 length:456 start_codon:yes stop_codon:yes gene_type:complete